MSNVESQLQYTKIISKRFDGVRIFLTGATGFVGKSLLKALIARGDYVTALYRTSVEDSENVKSLNADLTSIGYEDVEPHLKHCDTVIHTAARAHVTVDNSQRTFEQYKKTNTDATLALAEYAARAGVKTFIFLSSIKVNGDKTLPGERFKSDVSSPPSDPYGLSKYEAEQGLINLAKKSAMKVIIIRPPLIYGSELKGNLKSIIKVAATGVPLPLASIKNKRSVLSLENLIEFILLCSKKSEFLTPTNNIFIISDNEDISTSEFIQKLCEANKIKPRLFPFPISILRAVVFLLKKSDISNKLFDNLQVDSTLAKTTFDWTPSPGITNYSTIRDIND